MRNPVSLMRAGQELSAPLAAAAARFGRDRAHRAHRPAGQPRGAAVQGGDRAVHRGRAEPPGMVQAFAETDDAAEAVQHAKPVPGRRAHQQPAVVGAQVERRERRRRGPVPFGGVEAGGVGHGGGDLGGTGYHRRRTWGGASVKSTGRPDGVAISRRFRPVHYDIGTIRTHLRPHSARGQILTG